jgi:hypothetical protein
MLSAQRGEAGARLAIAERDAPLIHIYDARSGSDQPISSVTVRRRPAALARRAWEAGIRAAGSHAPGLSLAATAHQRYCSCWVLKQACL